LLGITLEARPVLRYWLDGLWFLIYLRQALRAIHLDENAKLSKFSSGVVKWKCSSHSHHSTEYPSGNR